MAEKPPDSGTGPSVEKLNEMIDWLRAVYSLNL